MATFPPSSIELSGPTPPEPLIEQIARNSDQQGTLPSTEKVGRVELCDPFDCPVHGMDDCELNRCVRKGCGLPAMFCTGHAKTLEISPIPMYLTCPKCGERHIDEGEFATRPHHTHSCQSCGLTWRPAVICTVGVQFLPGFKSP